MVAIKGEHKQEVQLDENGCVLFDLKKRILKNVKRQRAETNINEGNVPSPPPCKKFDPDESTKGTPGDPADFSEVPLHDLPNPDRQ